MPTGTFARCTQTDAPPWGAPCSTAVAFSPPLHFGLQLQTRQCCGVYFGLPTDRPKRTIDLILSFSFCFLGNLKLQRRSVGIESPGHAQPEQLAPRSWDMGSSQSWDNSVAAMAFFNVRPSCKVALPQHSRFGHAGTFCRWCHRHRCVVKGAVIARHLGRASRQMLGSSLFAYPKVPVRTVLVLEETSVALVMAADTVPGEQHETGHVSTARASHLERRSETELPRSARSLPAVSDLRQPQQGLKRHSLS
eukprot:SAG31_NODE_5385_length_2572_cov_2.465427_1_plen_250_part_00